MKRVNPEIAGQRSGSARSRSTPHSESHRPCRYNLGEERGAIFSDDLSGLTVALGLTGAGIAFALQDVVESLAGFFAETFGGYYEPGDRVQFGGVRGNGDLFFGRVVRISNGAVSRDPVFNYSGEFTRRSREAWQLLVTRHLIENARVESPRPPQKSRFLPKRRPRCDSPPSKNEEARDSRDV